MQAGIPAAVDVFGNIREVLRPHWRVQPGVPGVEVVAAHPGLLPSDRNGPEVVDEDMIHGREGYDTTVSAYEIATLSTFKLLIALSRFQCLLAREVTRDFHANHADIAV
jgi:hypothetical protein